MKKLALGLFHFNVQWQAGDPESYFRYAKAAVLPFLRLVESFPALRVTVEMAGSGLEYLQQATPEAITLLRQLINVGQIELISSLYSPSLWVAFPARDLRRSVIINKSCLSKLALPFSRTFFAQEALFGDGLRVLSDEFEYAICKDEYLSYFYDLDLTTPMFRMGALKVIVLSLIHI